MLTGVFNSIIYAGFRAVRGAARIAAAFLLGAFNKVNTAGGESAAPAPGKKPLSQSFNRHCNDNLSFSGNEGEDAEKKARVASLQAFLKHVMHNIATGAAHVQDALAIVQELESLGVKVAGLLALVPAVEPRREGLRHVPAMAA